MAASDDDPFALLDEQPALAAGDGAVIGGGWFGYLGYRLGARLERLPPGPPRPAPLPDFALAFYDHLLRLDRDGRWWFEALWTEARDHALRRRLELLRARLDHGIERRPLWVGTLAPSPQDALGHPEAVAACRERIAAGEIFQANMCLRLEGRWSGDPVDLFARTPARSRRGMPRSWPGRGARSAAPRPSSSCAAGAGTCSRSRSRAPRRGTEPRTRAAARWPARPRTAPRT